MRARISFTLTFLLGLGIRLGLAQVTPALPDLGFDHLRDYTQTSNGQEVYFTVQSLLGDVSVIMRMERQNGQWQSPTVATFSGEHKDLEPFLSPDGLRLYFASERPTSGINVPINKYDIYYVERTALSAPWSPVRPIPGPVNTIANEFYPAVTADYTLYFTCDRDGEDYLYRAAFENGAYTTPVRLPANLASGSCFNAYVTPDESMLIYTAVEVQGNTRNADLYLSQRGADGNWSAGRNLGHAINSKHIDYCPFWDREAKMLYFTSRRTNFPATKVKTAQELKKVLETPENGYSKLYKVPFSP